jgi:hypothetical protein
MHIGQLALAIVRGQKYFNKYAGKWVMLTHPSGEQHCVHVHHTEDPNGHRGAFVMLVNPQHKCTTHFPVYWNTKLEALPYRPD